MRRINQARSLDIIRFKQYNGGNSWVVLGGLTPWSDDTHPPAEPANATSISDAFCAIKATLRWVKEDPSGLITFIDAQGNLRTFLEYTSVADVLAHNVTDLMFEAMATGAQINQSAFRIIGFYTNLVPTTGHESDTFLTAAYVSSWGNLEALEYRIPYNVISTETYRKRNILQY